MTARAAANSFLKRTMTIAAASMNRPAAMRSAATKPTRVPVAKSQSRSGWPKISGNVTPAVKLASESAITAEAAAYPAASQGSAAMTRLRHRKEHSSPAGPARNKKIIPPSKPAWVAYPAAFAISARNSITAVRDPPG